MEGEKFIVLTGRTGAKIALRAKDIVALEEVYNTDYTTNVEVLKPISKLYSYYVKQTVDEILKMIEKNYVQTNEQKNNF